MDMNERKATEKAGKINKSHLQGFVAGILITAILATTGIFNFFSNDHSETNLLGTPILQSASYITKDTFGQEVLNAPGQTLVYFDNLSIAGQILADIMGSIRSNSDANIKIFDATFDVDKYNFIESLGLYPGYLPLFAMFEDGVVLGTFSLELAIQEDPVVQWLNSFRQPKVYRVFPSSAFNSLGRANGYYLSELCLIPEAQWGIGSFIKLDGDMTLPIKDNTALYSLLSNTFGGDGKTTFGLPNLDSQIPGSALKYYICKNGYFPERGYEQRREFISGNIKYLEVSIDELEYMTPFVGQIFLAKNVDEVQQKILLPCDGRTVNNAMLASVLGYKSTTFNLPDLSNATSPIEGAKYYIVVEGLYPTP